MLWPHSNQWIVDEQPFNRPPSLLSRAWKGFLSVSLVLVLVVIASLIGVGGASLFIYRQMSKEVTVVKNSDGKNPSVSSGVDSSSQPKVAQSSSLDPGAHHSEIPTVADSSEWHFAEFSDQPRYIDVTYDGGRQHARLKVNTVLSPELNTASSVTNDENPDDGDNTIQLSDPGSHYILNKDGRVVGVDGTVGAAQEVRRAQAVQVPSSTIRNPVPEVRVASPVLQYGRPLFEGDQPAQSTGLHSTYVPARRALPINPGSNPSFNAAAEVADDGTPVQRALPIYRDPRLPRDDRSAQFPDNTSVFQRDR